MSQKLAALMMMFGGSTFALAQSGETPEVPQSAAEVEAEIERDIANAEVSTGHFAAELGAGFRKGVGPEFRLSWYQDDEQVYGLKIGQYSRENIATFDKFTLLSVSLLSRFSLEDSFFVEGGLDITQIKATIDEAEKLSTAGAGTYGFDGSVNQAYLQMSFGNQWQTGSWTYGVDWINLYVPFTGSSFTTRSSGTIVDQDSRERQNKRDMKTEAWDINYGISAHAGMIF